MAPPPATPSTNRWAQACWPTIPPRWSARRVWISMGTSNPETTPSSSIRAEWATKPAGDPPEQEQWHARTIRGLVKGFGNCLNLPCGRWRYRFTRINLQRDQFGTAGPFTDHQGLCGRHKTYERRFCVVVRQAAGDKQILFTLERFTEAAGAHPGVLVAVEGQQRSRKGNPTTGQGDRQQRLRHPCGIWADDGD